MAWLRRATIALGVLVAFQSTESWAQAVVGEKGSLSGGLSYGFGFADDIVFTDGQVFPDAYINTHTTTLELEYAPIDKLGIDVALPLVGSKYDMDKSGAQYDPHGPYDDGKYHFTLQDFRGDVRYQLLDEPLALSVGVGVTLPVADYAVQGSAAAGRHLKQGRIGVAVSYMPEPVPRSFVNAAYYLTLSEKFDQTPDTAKFGQTRSNANLQIGYLPIDTLGVFLLADYRRQHDGVDFVDYDMLTQSQKDFHDPILRESALLLGLGATYQLTDKLNVTGSYAHFITGENTLTMNVLTVSLWWDIL